MIERKIYQKMLDWKNRKHNCLVVTGQRQVGKTFIIDAFARKEYDNYIHLDLSSKPEYKNIFEGNVDISEILKKFDLYFGSDAIIEGSTLLFIDEIQESYWAYSSLKQFSIYGKSM